MEKGRQTQIDNDQVKGGHCVLRTSKYTICLIYNFNGQREITMTICFKC